MEIQEKYMKEALKQARKAYKLGRSYPQIKKQE